MPAPSVPPAPPLLSMTNCLPVFLTIAANNGRAKASVPPPGGKGTTMVTGLVGHDWAWARPQGAKAISAAALASRVRRGWAAEGGERVMLSPVGARCEASRAGSEQGRKGAGMYHPTPHETVVAGLDAGQVVEVVDHQAGGLLQSLGRQVGLGVEALEPGAVVEVEARHRVSSGQR